MIKKLPLLVLTLMLSIFPIRQIYAQEPTLNDVGSYSQDARSARITKLKELYRVNLTDKERERVINRCDQAQENLQKIMDKLDSVTTSRSKSYGLVVTTLISLRGQIASKEIDASNIELLIVEYQQKIQQYNSAVANYELTLNDATLVDCKAYPEDFRAALEGVRAARKEVVAASAGIDEITKSNLKTTFETLKNRLEIGASSDGK